MSENTRRTPALPVAGSKAGVTAVFVRACGMADDTALAWMEAVYPSWEKVWHRWGAEVLAEVRLSGHEQVADRLIDLFGDPAARATGLTGACRAPR